MLFSISDVANKVENVTVEVSDCPDGNNCTLYRGNTYYLKTTFSKYKSFLYKSINVVEATENRLTLNQSCAIKTDNLNQENLYLVGSTTVMCGIETGLKMYLTE